MKKIVIVEDDLSILEMYKTKFELEKYKVSVAHNGVEGLKVIERAKPDIILLDLMMPEMTGDEMLSELRKQPWGKKVPVIILTNMSEDETPSILKLLDVEEFIIKASTSPGQVLDRVDTVLRCHNKKVTRAT